MNQKAMIWFKWMCLVILLYTGILTSNAQLPDSLKKLYVYNSSVPFQYSEINQFVYTNPDISLYDLKDSSKRATEFHVRVKLVNYKINDSISAVAWVTTPNSFDSLTPRPVIVFQHWGEGDKDQFLSEAIDFSKKGFICLLPDAIFLLPNTPYNSYIRHGLYIIKTGAINVQRGLDMLQENMNVDNRNIFFVGHSHGAAIGSILTAIEPRFQSFILLTPVYSTTKGLRESNREDVLYWKKNHPTEFEEWLNWMRPVDADLYIKHKTKPVFLQLATKDEFITMKQFKELEKITSPPKKVIYYQALHALNNQARKDRYLYITQNLKK